MKYFMIAGEASGDIHGSQLISSIREHDPEAEFQFLGGDMMAGAAGCQPIIHYRDMAFMGFIEVIKHLRSIMGFMRRAQEGIKAFKPDALVLIDYPSFNLKMARFAHQRGLPVFYFISPKVWAWKEWRVKQIKEYVDRVYSILPFETEFFARHGYEVQYVGNPTVKEIAMARTAFGTPGEFAARNGLDPHKPVIAIVPGSRVKEVRDNLPSMLAACARHPEYQTVIAGAPSLDAALYASVMGHSSVPVVHGQSFELVAHARAALVTSGTATLETAILGTPQVACYRMNGSKLVYRFYSLLIHGKYVTLPNLIADEPVIPELLLHLCNADTIDSHLAALLADSPQRRQMLDGYARMAKRLGAADCTDNTASAIISYLNEYNKA